MRDRGRQREVVPFEVIEPTVPKSRGKDKYRMTESGGPESSRNSKRSSSKKRSSSTKRSGDSSKKRSSSKSRSRSRSKSRSRSHSKSDSKSHRSRSKSASKPTPKSHRSRSKTPSSRGKEVAKSDERKSHRRSSSRSKSHRSRSKSRSRSHSRGHSRSRSRSQSKSRSGPRQDKTLSRTRSYRSKSKTKHNDDKHKKKSKSSKKHGHKHRHKKSNKKGDNAVIDRVPTAMGYNSDDSVEELLEERSKYSRYSIEPYEEDREAAEEHEKYEGSLNDDKYSASFHEYGNHIDSLFSESTEDAPQWREELSTPKDGHDQSSKKSRSSSKKSKSSSKKKKNKKDKESKKQKQKIMIENPPVLDKERENPEEPVEVDDYDGEDLPLVTGGAWNDMHVHSFTDETEGYTDPVYSKPSGVAWSSGESRSRKYDVKAEKKRVEEKKRIMRELQRKTKKEIEKEKELEKKFDQALLDADNDDEDDEQRGTNIAPIVSDTSSLTDAITDRRASSAKPPRMQNVSEPSPSMGKILVKGLANMTGFSHMAPSPVIRDFGKSSGTTGEGKLDSSPSEDINVRTVTLDTSGSNEVEIVSVLEGIANAESPAESQSMAFSFDDTDTDARTEDTETSKDTPSDTEEELEPSNKKMSTSKSAASVKTASSGLRRFFGFRRGKTSTPVPSPSSGQRNSQRKAAERLKPRSTTRSKSPSSSPRHSKDKKATPMSKRSQSPTRSEDNRKSKSQDSTKPKTRKTVVKGAPGSTPKPQSPSTDLSEDDKYAMYNKSLMTEDSEDLGLDNRYDPQTNEASKKIAEDAVLVSRKKSVDPIEFDDYSDDGEVNKKNDPPLVQCLKFYSCGAAAQAADIAIRTVDCTGGSERLPLHEEYEDEVMTLRLRDAGEEPRELTIDTVPSDDILEPISSLKEAPSLNLPKTPTRVVEVSGMKLNLDEDEEAREREAAVKRAKERAEAETLSITHIEFPTSPSSIASNEIDDDKRVKKRPSKRTKGQEKHRLGFFGRLRRTV